MKGNYEYTPDKYKTVMGLSEDLKEFYRLLERFKEDKTMTNRLRMEKALNDLLFTIKHREVEGVITHNTATELRVYLREVSDD